jgi:predicted transcriptional regulator
MTEQLRHLSDGMRHGDAGRTRLRRYSLGLSQRSFWEPVGVSQPVASRYEAGQTTIPRPVRLLLVLAYGTPSDSLRLYNELRKRKGNA